MANEFKTLPIGTIFTYNGNKYKVCKDDDCFCTCSKCTFNGINCDTLKHIRGNCGLNYRTDYAQVYYEQINNEIMEKDSCNVVSPSFNTNNYLNDLHIDCPKGYSIDVEHSDLSKGIIKFKDANITLEDIPCIIRDDIKINAFISKSSTYYNYLKKLKAIATLIDIAKYYNGDWKPDWSNNKEGKFYISYNFIHNAYFVIEDNSNNVGTIVFKRQEDAQAVIDNPNFRYILDTIYKE